LEKKKVDDILREREKAPFTDRNDFEKRTGYKNTLKRKLSDFLFWKPTDSNN